LWTQYSEGAETQVEEIASRLPSLNDLSSRPLDGLRVALIENTLGDGVDASVRDTARATAQHLEHLGATIGSVNLATFDSGLAAYYIIATSEASSNLSRSDYVDLR
jgi:aspartyl-tRNA(Asn)/glutamyl-tRNA(Gln) amidotransferase subunit A